MIPWRYTDKLVQAFSGAGELVFDPFAPFRRFGLDVLATARSMGRCHLGIELEEGYHGIATRRLTSEPPDSPALPHNSLHTDRWRAAIKNPHPTNRSVRKWRVAVIEWLSHVAIIEADTVEEAEAQAYQLWAKHGEHEVFSFKDAGINCVQVEEA